MMIAANGKGGPQFLSTHPADLPFPVQPGVRSTYRSITVDGEEIEFTGGFADLHTRVYEETLAGRGFGLQQARPSIALVHRLRQAEISPKDGMQHDFLK